MQNLIHLKILCIQYNNIIIIVVKYVSLLNDLKQNDLKQTNDTYMNKHQRSVHDVSKPRYKLPRDYTQYI